MTGSDAAWATLGAGSGRSGGPPEIRHRWAKGRARALQVAFEDEEWAVVKSPASTARMRFPGPDWDAAISELTVMNRRETADGRRLSSVLEWNGFHVWWFGQDYLFRGLLLPVRQYRDLIDMAWRAGEIRVQNPPRLFRLYVVPVLRRLGVRCEIEGAPRLRWRRCAAVAGFVTSLGISLAAMLVCLLARRPVLLYALRPVHPQLRCDRRLRDLYGELWRKNVPFMELVFSEAPADQLRQDGRRGRAAIWYRQVLALFEWLLPSRRRPPLQGEPLDPIERAIIDAYWNHVVRRLRRTRVLRALFRLLRPAVLLILDDSREMFPLIAAAKSCGVRTISYQHGAVMRYHVGLFCYGREDGGRNHGADRYFVWSDFVRDLLLERSRLFTVDQLVVAGHIRRHVRRSVRDRGTSAKIRVLWVGEPLAHLEAMKPIIEAISEDEEIAITYLPRRDGLDAAHQAEIKRWRLEILFSPHERLDDALSEADVVIGTYSSVLAECYLHLVPSVVIWVEVGWRSEMCQEKWAIVARSPSEMRTRISEAARLGVGELLEIQHRLWGEADRWGFVEVVGACQEWLRRGLRRHRRCSDYRGANSGKSAG